MKKQFWKRNSPEPQGRRRPVRTQQPPAFSYYSQRSPVSRSNPSAPRRRLDMSVASATVSRSGSALARAVGSRFGLIIALIVALVSFVHIMSLSSAIRVAPLGDSSSSYFLHSTATYQQTAQKLFNVSVLNRNKLTFDAKAIEAGMMAQYPELADVAITLPLVGTRPIMYIQPTEPALVLLTISQTSYVVDANGKALIVADTPAVLRNLPVVHDQSGLPIHIGQTVLSSTSVRFVQTVVHQLGAQGIGITSLTLPADTDELDASISGQPYFVKFNLATSDAAQQTGTFIAVQQKLSKQGITPAAYIDVRVDGRAYYK